jgi:cbb3-type cytochrome oxidase subunit 3
MMLDTTNLVWYSSIAVEFLFCLHLIWSKVAKTYLIFTICLGFSVVRSLAAIYFMQGAVGPRLPLKYTYFWLWDEPFWLGLQIAVAWEVHKQMWKDHRDVLRQTRPLLIFAIVTAFTAAAIPVRSEALHGSSSRLILVMHFGIQATRYISSVLAIFLVLSAVLYFVLVGNRRTSGAMRHDGIMAAYFSIYAIAAFLIDAGFSRAVFVNGYFVSAITLCFIAWFSAFRPQPIPE